MTKETGIDWIDRIVAEANELEDRLNKLDEFLKTDKFKSLTKFEQSLLVSQKTHMYSYLYVLQQRVQFYTKG